MPLSAPLVPDIVAVAVNLSRELLQDSALVGKIGRVLTGRVIKFLQQQLAEDRKAYEKFYSEFSRMGRAATSCLLSRCVWDRQLLGGGYLYRLSA